MAWRSLVASFATAAVLVLGLAGVAAAQEKAKDEAPPKEAGKEKATEQPDAASAKTPAAKKASKPEKATLGGGCF